MYCFHCLSIESKIIFRSDGSTYILLPQTFCDHLVYIITLSHFKMNGFDYRVQQSVHQLFGQQLDVLLTKQNHIQCLFCSTSWYYNKKESLTDGIETRSFFCFRNFCFLQVDTVTLKHIGRKLYKHTVVQNISNNNERFKKKYGKQCTCNHKLILDMQHKIFTYNHK